MQDQQSAGRRFVTGSLFALLAGFLVSLGNPVDALKSQLRHDTHQMQTDLKLAARTLERLYSDSIRA